MQSSTWWAPSWSGIAQIRNYLPAENEVSVPERGNPDGNRHIKRVCPVRWQKLPKVRCPPLPSFWTVELKWRCWESGTWQRQGVIPTHSWPTADLWWCQAPCDTGKRHSNARLSISWYQTWNLIGSGVQRLRKHLFTKLPTDQELSCSCATNKSLTFEIRVWWFGMKTSCTAMICTLCCFQRNKDKNVANSAWRWQARDVGRSHARTGVHRVGLFFLGIWTSFFVKGRVVVVVEDVYWVHLLYISRNLCMCLKASVINGIILTPICHLPRQKNILKSNFDIAQSLHRKRPGASSCSHVTGCITAPSQTGLSTALPSFMLRDSG